MSEEQGKMIVLSGLAGAGKDSLADVLVEEHRYRKFSLSDKMKRFCEDVFGWSEDQLWGPSKFRNEPDPTWTRPCKACRGFGTIEIELMGTVNPQKCPQCDGTKTLNDNSPRRVLQLLGDEWGRQMIHPDIWTRTNRRQLQSYMDLGEKVVIVDARFQNDRNNLHEWFGAKRIHVVNTLLKPDSTEAWRAHGSENDQPSSDDMDMAFIIGEAWPFPSMSKLVEGMLGAL